MSDPARRGFRSVGRYLDGRGIRAEYPEEQADRWGYPAMDDLDDRDQLAVPMGHWRSVTDPSEDVVLTTDGFSSCVAIMAYDTDQRVGFLSHSVYGDEVDGVNEHLREFVDQLERTGDSYELTVEYAVSNQPDIGTVERAMDTVGSVASDDVAVTEQQMTYVGRNSGVALDMRDCGRYTYEETSYWDEQF